jgi:hypothetical protein
MSPARLAVSVLLWCFPSVAAAQTAITWTGATSADWNTAANWNPAQVPTAVDDVTVPGPPGIPNFPSIVGLTVQTHDLALLGGSSLLVNGASVIEAAGDVFLGAPLNSVAFPALATVRLLGTEDAAMISTAPIDANLDLAKSAGSVTLGDNFFNGALTSTNTAVIVASGVTAAFGDNGSFTGGSFSCASTTGFLDIPGSLFFSGTSVTSTASVLCGVDFTADANFAPTAGAVVLSGPFPKAVTVAGSFFDLTLSGSGATSVVAGSIAGDLTIGAGSGGLTLAAGVTLAIGDGLSATGGTLVSANATAVFDVAGDVSLTGGTVAGNFVARCGGDWSSGAGFHPTSGTVTFDGAAAQTVAATSSFANVEAAGVDVIFSSLTITGSFVASSGQATVATGATLAIAGDATFSGGAPFSANAAAQFDVAGAVNVSAATPWPFANLDVGGDWTATAATTVAGGLVTFDGATGPTISGPAAFFDLTLAATGAAAIDAATVAGDLLVQTGGCTLAAGATLTIAGDATFAAGPIVSGDATAIFAIAGAATFSGATASGVFSADVGGDWTATAAFAPTDGRVRFVAATTQTVGGAGTFFAVEVAGPGATGFSSVVVADDFTASGGATTVAAGATIAVGGAASFTGGSVASADVTARFDVAGATTFAGATAGLLVFDAAGDFTTDATFAPTSGVVTFDGAGPQAVGGLGVFATVVVAGAAVTASALHAAGPTVVSGALVAAGPLDFDDDFTVGVGASFVDGGFVHCVGGDATLTGSTTLTGTLKFDGTGAVVVPKSGALAGVQVAKTGGGSVAFGAACQIAGAFDVLAGTATGGVLDIDGPATIALGGALTLSGAAFFSGDLTLFGSLSTPALTFDGPSATATAAALPGFTVDKPGATLQIGPVAAAGAVATTAGTLSATGALTVDGAFTVAAGATFAAGAFTHEFRGAFLADGATSSTGVFRFAPPAAGFFAPPVVARAASGFPAVVVAGAPGRVVGFGPGAATFSATLTAQSGVALLSGASTVAGDVLVAGGSLFVTAGATLQANLVQTSGATLVSAPTTVQGDATFSGGTFAATATLDVQDDVVFNGATVGGAAEIRVGGDWTSGPLFAPTSGTVVFAGAAPQFVFGTPVLRRMTILAGADVTAVVALRVTNAASIGGAFTATAASFDCDGSFAASAGAACAFGGGTHFFGGAFSAAAGALSFTAGARCVFDGAVSATPIVADALPDVEAAKTGGAALTLANVAIGGDLLLTAGRLTTGSGVAVTGDFLASGGVYGSSDSTSPAAVQGNASFANTTAEVVGLEVAGDFASDATFLPTGGALGLFGPGSRQITGAGTFGACAMILRDGVTSAGAAIHVDGDFTVLAPATFDAAATTHFFGGDFLCLGALGPDGAYQFEATLDQTAVSVAALPALNINKTGGATLRTGDATVAPVLNATTLFMSFGSLVVAAGTTLHVATDAVLTAGTFATETGAVLDVDGALSFVNIVVAGAAEARVGGAFNGGPGFQPTSGAITFDGLALQPLQLAAAAAGFRDLVVAAGATVDVQSSTGLLVFGATHVFGVLQSQFASNFRGALIVETGGSFDGGDAVHNCGGDVVIHGQMIHVSELVLDGSAAAEIGGVAPMPTTTIGKTGPGSLRLGGALPFATPALALLSGFAFVPASTTAVVSGSANFSGGSFASENAAAVLDVAGDLLLAGCVVNGAASFDVGGAFVADPDFAPTSGRVRFDGPAGTSAAPSTPGGALTFAGLVVAAGTLTLATDVVVQADAIDVLAGAVLRTAAAVVTLGPTALDVDGEIFVDAGGVLRLDDATPLIVPVGASLRLAGAAAQPAEIAANGPLGFTAHVAGSLAARNFRLVGPAAAGFVIDVTASVAAAPDDFRGGVLTNPAAGGVLLDVRRSDPTAATTTFRYLDFENPLGAVGAANARASFGTPIAFENFGGGFGGEAFDDDAAGRITWAAGSATALAAFTATPGATAVTLSFATTLEVDAAAFVVERREPPGGVFTFIGETPAAAAPGGGFGYQIVDGTAVASTAYEYRLVQRFTHGALLPLGVVSAQTLLLQPGAAAAFGVGPGRSFATPQDAIDAALLLGAPRPIVRLAPGVHPAFEIGATPPGGIRIVGDGPGVILDAASASLRIHGLSFGVSVELRDLVIDAGGAAHSALVVENCASPVVVDGCTILATLAPAARVSGSVGAAFQRTTTQGAPGLRAELGSAASYCGGVASGVDLVGAKLRSVGAALGVVAVDATATHTAYGGAAAIVSVPAASYLGGLCGVGLAAEPGRPFVLLASGGLAYAPPGGVLEMPLLLDLSSLVLLGVGATDVAGQALLPLIVPPLPGLVGFSLAFQAAVVDPTLGTVRFSSAGSSTVVG